MTLDAGRLREAHAILAEQLDQATSDATWQVIDTAVRWAERAVLVTELAQTEAPPPLQPSRQIQVPDQVLRQMLETGKDVWIGAILGWSHSQIRRRRRKLRVRPFSPGGDPEANALAYRRWTNEWHKRLQTMGLWPSA